MVNIKFKNLPISIQDQFRSIYREYSLEYDVTFSQEIGENIIKRILQMDVKYLDMGHASFNNDVIRFNNEKEYTWFLMKYDQTKV